MFSLSWTTCILILLGVLFFFYLFFSGGEHEFIGIEPLMHPDFTLIPQGITEVIGVGTEVGTEREDEIEICTITEIEEVPFVPEKRKSKWKRQEECCRIIEEIFGRPFKRDIRPNFLKNPETGANLELDCYSPELGVALEHNGKQHYEYPNAFHRTREQWESQVRRDEYKIKVCDRNDVYLVTIPYSIPYGKLKDEILRQLAPIL